MITLKNYLDRLQMSGAPGVSPAELSKLHERHLLTVPFENLDILRGTPITLSIESIVDKVVTHRRGGFCYELNGAFAWLLRELGYQVSMLESRVYNDAGEIGIPFDHLALRVDFDDASYLCDVGFGRGFLSPIDWNLRDPVRERGDTWELKEKDGLLLLTQLDRKTMSMRPVYTIDPTPRELEDFEEGCRFHQESPESPFTSDLIAAIAAPDGRIAIRGKTFAMTRNARREEKELADDEAVFRELKRYMGISLA